MHKIYIQALWILYYPVEALERKTLKGFCLSRADKMEVKNLIPIIAIQDE